MELNVKDRAKLAKAVEGRNSEQGYILARPADYKTLIDAGLVDVDPNTKQGANVAMRASDAGVAQMNGGQPAGQPAQEATGENGGPEGGADETGEEGTEAGEETEQVTRSAYDLDNDIPIPKVVRRPEGSKYPFKIMEIGQSFHVPKTAEMSNPVKSLASSVSAANIDASEPVPGQHKTRRGNMVDNYRLTKKFVVRPAAKDDPKGPGARIFRVPLPANPVVDGSTAAD